MFLRFFLLISFLLVSNTSFGKIAFYLSEVDDPQACERKIQSWIAEVNNSLPAEWIPSDFIVLGSSIQHQYTYRTVFTDINENIWEKIIRVGSTCEKAHFIHEYGHLVLDDFMRKNSPPWQYNIIWTIVSFEDIDTAKESYLELLEKLRTARREYQEERLNSSETASDAYLAKLNEIIDVNLPMKIKQYEDMVSKLSQAQEIQSKSPVALNQFMHFSALLAFHELFAETLAVTVLADWSIMKKVSMPFLESENFVVLPEVPGGDRDKAVSSYLLCRDFSQKNFPNYSFHGWEETIEYCHFIPLRSFIRGFMEEKPFINPGDMLQALGLAIIDVYENELIPEPKNLNRSLEEKNKSLLQKLRIQLSLIEEKFRLNWVEATK